MKNIGILSSKFKTVAGVVNWLTGLGGQRLVISQRRFPPEQNPTPLHPWGRPGPNLAQVLQGAIQQNVDVERHFTSCNPAGGRGDGWAGGQGQGLHKEGVGRGGAPHRF